MFTAFRALSANAQVGYTLAIACMMGGALLAVFWVVFTQTDMSRLEQGQLLLLVTTIGGFVGTYLRESRNRNWAIADREAGLKQQTNEIIAKAQAEATALLISTEAKAQAIHFEVQAAAERIRLETLRAAAVLREDQRVTAEILATQIADVKVEAKRAYTEANHVNVKIENLNKRLLEEEQSADKKAVSAATDKKLDQIQTTADGIDDKVDQLTQGKGVR